MLVSDHNSSYNEPMANQKIFIGYNPECSGTRTLEAYPPAPALFDVLGSTFNTGLDEPRWIDSGDGYVAVFEATETPRQLAKELWALIARGLHGEPFDIIPCNSAEYERALKGAKDDEERYRTYPPSGLTAGNASYTPHDSSKPDEKQPLERQPLTQPGGPQTR